MSLFLNKVASQASRVLNEEDCPPHNVEHNIYDYPKYYDVIYYPELYVQHFATPDTCALWLTRDLAVHLSSCNKCLERTQNIPDLEIYVRRVDPFFALTLSDITINIQVQKIEEEKYNQCSIVLLWLPVCTFIIRTYVSYFEKFQS